jgi:hypothetical protein
MPAGSAAPSPPAGTAQDAADHPGEAAETISMMMRRDAILVERPRRRRWWAGALGLAAAAVLVAGFAAWRAAGNGSAPPAGSARRASPDEQAAMHAAGGGPSGSGSIGATTADSSSRGESLPTVSPATSPSGPVRGPGEAVAITSPAPAIAGNPPRRKQSAATGHSGSTSGRAPGGREPSATGRAASAANGHAPGPDEPAVTGKRGAAATKKSPAVRVPEGSERRVLDDHSSPSLPSGPPGGLAEPVASRGAPAPSSAASDASGWYAIDSNPYATIFIDDRKIGDTPLDRIPLAPGGHRVRAVLADGRQRSFAIEIAPDRKTSSGTLAW